LVFFRELEEEAERGGRPVAVAEAASGVGRGAVEAALETEQAAATAVAVEAL
jgi:hypothetical protein